MKNSGRRHLNRKVIALVLALAMLFSQNALVYAAEGAVSGNETVEAPADVPAAEEVTEPSQETPADESQTPADQGETPAEDQKPAEAAEPASEEPAGEEAAVSENEAQPEETVSEEEAEPVAEEAASELGNKVSDNTISLSGGTITISINKSANSESENLTYAKNITVSESKIVKYVGEAIGFDFDVLSENAASQNKLTEGVDYEVTWKYIQDGAGDVGPIDKNYTILETGTIIVSINGLSHNGTGFKNWLNIQARVVPQIVPKISENDVIVSYISYNIVQISNNSSTNTIYVGIVSRNGLTGDIRVQGDYISPKAKRVFYSYYIDSNTRTEITEKQPLTVVASYSKDYIAKKEYIGKNKATDADAGVYYEDITTKEKTGGGSTGPADGSAINMKAVVNKATQTIKITWNPAKNLGFKYYELQRLGTDEETFTTLANWKDSKGNTKLAKTSFAYAKTEVERAEQFAVFQLICYDKDKTEKARYITVAAPSLLYVEQGYDTNNMEYCFSKLKQDNDLAYRLELAAKNNEAAFKETEDLAKKNEYYSTDMAEIKDFKINNKVSVNALREFFIADGSTLKLEPGKTYFARVRGVYYWHGTQYTSAPSNVVSRKAGPSKVYVFDVNGRQYTKPTGNAAKKDTIEAENIKIMTEYLDNEFNMGEYTPLSNNGFIHKGNEGPDAKSGYVVFFADRISDNKLKAFELLRSDTQYGTYKKLKAYKIGNNDEPVKYSGLYKWTPTDEKVKDLLDKSGLDIYYLQYNNFPPEKTYYYAVRGVYRNGGAAGGFGDGYECTAELDSVQNIYAFDGTIDKINLYWRYDACVKEYWVYKKQYTGGDSGNPSEFTKLSDYKLLKKVKGKKSGTLRADSKKAADQELIVTTSGNLLGDYVKFIDKDNTKYADKSKNEVKEGTTYQYVVIPMYQTKNADVNNPYNLPKRSDVAHGMATLTNAKIKNFKAANYGVERIRISWSKLKGATAYLIVRTSSNPNEVPMDKWADEKLWVPNNDPDATAEERTAFNKCAFIDGTAVVGTRYYYVIFAGSEKSGSITNGQVKTARSLPLAVTDVTVENGPESNYKKGAKIKWTPNSRDSGRGVKYKVQCRDDSESWRTIHTGGGTEWTDDTDLGRGVVRQYRVVSVYGDFDGGIKEGRSYSKPTKIRIDGGSTSLALGESTTINVYAERDSGASASDLRMDDPGYNGNLIEITGTKTEGDHVAYTIRAKARGTTSFTAYAFKHDWTSNTSSSNLSQSITITVR